MFKRASIAKTAEYLNAHPHLTMDEACRAMVELGMFLKNTHARARYRYCVQTGKAPGTLTNLRPRRSKTRVSEAQQAVNERAVTVAQATVGEPEEATGYDPTAPETLAQRKARQARERRAAKKAQQVQA